MYNVTHSGADIHQLAIYQTVSQLVNELLFR